MIERHTVYPKGTPFPEPTQAHRAESIVPQEVPEKDKGECFWFWCDGCDTHHTFTTKHPKGGKGPCWKFDGNMEKPTFTPSLLYPGWNNTKGKRVGRCHLVLRDGMVHYLEDCDHELRNQTVPVESPK